MGLEIGYRFTSYSGESCEVVSCTSKTQYGVAVEGVFAGVFRPQHIKIGKIRNPFRKSLHGIGYVGMGKHKSRTVAYRKWANMITRCYSEDRTGFQTYNDVTVCADWHNHQNFADWFYKQEGCENSAWQLEKDILVLGNRVYSPKTCCLVPRGLNNFVASLNEDVSGFSLHEHSGLYRAEYHTEGRTKSLGYYKDPENAAAAYKAMKDSLRVVTFDKYKDMLPAHVRDAYVKNYIERV